MTTITEAYNWTGRQIIDSDGEKIGTIRQIYEDTTTGKPEWALVSGGLFGTRSHFVPLAGVQPTGEELRAAVTKEQVKAAPSVENEQELSEGEERQLFRHYGVPYTGEGSTTAEGAPGSGSGQGGNGYDVSGPTTDDAMTRSEEELRVGKMSQESGRARLRKYVVTENVQTTVPVQRE